MLCSHSGAVSNRSAAKATASRIASRWCSASSERLWSVMSMKLDDDLAQLAVGSEHRHRVDLQPAPLGDRVD